VLLLESDAMIMSSYNQHFGILIPSISSLPPSSATLTIACS
jgi:hypothetical protein